jgi:hypothetical protein
LPPDFDDLINDEAVIDQIASRLEAVFKRYRCDLNDGGWRDLALKLALKYEPVLKLRAVDEEDSDASTLPVAFVNTVLLRQEMRHSADTHKANYCGRRIVQPTQPHSSNLSPLNVVAAGMSHGYAVLRWIRGWQRSELIWRAAKAAARKLEQKQSLSVTEPER